MGTNIAEGRRSREIRFIGPQKEAWRILLVTVVIVAGVLVVLAAVGRADRWPPPENPPRQGEALDAAALRRGQIAHAAPALARLIREPENTWSNLAFVLGGAVLLVLASRRSAAVVGVALIAVGAGSFLYHASASRALRHLDVGAMYWLYLAAVIFAAGALSSRLRHHLDGHGVLLLLVPLLLAAAAASGRNLRILGFKPLALTVATTVAAGVLVTALLLTAWRRRTTAIFIRVAVIVVLFTAAVICQVGDRPGGWLCDPEAAVQAHALWHVLSAAAFVLCIRTLDWPEDRVVRSSTLDGTGHFAART